MQAPLLQALTTFAIEYSARCSNYSLSFELLIMIELATRQSRRGAQRDHLEVARLLSFEGVHLSHWHAKR